MNIDLTAGIFPREGQVRKIGTVNSENNGLSLSNVKTQIPNDNGAICSTRDRYFIMAICGASSMSGRRRVVWALISVGFVVAAVAGYFAYRLPRTPWDSILAKIGHSHPNNIKGILAKANYFYWLHNFPKSTPLYQRAE